MSTRPEGLSTRLIHHAYQAPDGFAAPQIGVHKASTVYFPNTAALLARDWKQRDSYTYGLHGTPTTLTLEERIATLEGGLQTVLVPSGLAAIALADMALLKTGDELLIPENSYGPNKELARVELAAYGIGHRFYDPMDPASLAAAITPATRMVWLEAAGSITMEFPDLPALIETAKARGVLTALDNTWGAGVAFDAFALGVDLTAHALTKFPSGGGDVLMGAVTTRDEALHLRLKGTHMRMGWGVAGNDAEAILRGLPSIALRYRAGDESARRLAQWFQARPEIQCVLHPALPGAPGHEHWKKLCTQAAGLFSVVFQPQYTPAQVHAFVDALHRFKIGYSWAGPVSLAVPYDLPALRKQPTWNGGLVRFSMGLEDVEDLIADCEAALAGMLRP